MKSITLLGSSGSIGTQVKQVVRRNPDKFCIKAMTVNTSVEGLIDDIKEFNLEAVGITDPESFSRIRHDIPKNVDVFLGNDALGAVAAIESADTAVVSVVGMCGLRAVLAAIESGKHVALANKESLVAGGEIVMRAAKNKGVSILPVDSEHSAIFQCLHTSDRQYLKRLILTASGGPFRNYSQEQMNNITPEMALKHPTWNMGAKITIDSATLMNKGLEVLEAKWLFDTDDIECVVHPQSIIHSMVEWRDGSVIAQMSYPTMEIPIQLALSYPERLPSTVKALDFVTLKKLEFEAIDKDKFKCFGLALKSMSMGGIYPAVMNSANEAAVDLFLKRKIRFNDIAAIIDAALSCDYKIKNASVDEIYYIDSLIKSQIFSRF